MQKGGMTQKYRTTIRETQNLNTWSVDLGPAVILSTTWWNSTWCEHGPAILIKGLRYYNNQFCSRWIKLGLDGRHWASKSGSADSRQTSFVSDKVKWMGHCIPVFPILQQFKTLLKHSCARQDPKKSIWVHYQAQTIKVNSNLSTLNFILR